MTHIEPEHKVRQCALNWFDKGVITLDALEDINTLYSSNPVVESNSKHDREEFKDGKSYIDYNMKMLKIMTVLLGGI